MLLNLGRTVPAELVVDEAKGVLDVGRLAMSVVASINCVENFAKDPAGPTMAQEILKEKGLPESLRHQLKTFKLK